MMNDGLRKVENEYKQARAKYDRFLVDIQTKCPHKDVYERDYFKIAEWMDAHPPVRICENCGLCEEGWGCGYLVLRSPSTVTTIPKNAEFYYRRGRMVRESDKGPLLRKEKTLEDILND